MKKILILFFCFLLSSCQWFDNTVPDKHILVEEKLNGINWREVSSYPSIDGCDTVQDRVIRKNCFFEKMALLIQQKLEADTLAVLYPEQDTIMVEVTVFSDSRLGFKPQIKQDSIGNKTIIDSILKVRLVDFPPIEPAQKEGVPVTTQFKLPVIINIAQ